MPYNIGTDTNVGDHKKKSGHVQNPFFGKNIFFNPIIKEKIAEDWNKL